MPHGEHQAGFQNDLAATYLRFEPKSVDGALGIRIVDHWQSITRIIDAHGHVVTAAPSGSIVFTDLRQARGGRAAPDTI